MTVRPVGGRLTVLHADDEPLWGRTRGDEREPRAATPTGLAAGSRHGWDRFGRVLSVRLDAMGDVVMTTPAIRALKAARPDRYLGLLTSPAGAAVAALVPEVDEVIAYEAPWMKASDTRADPAPDLALVERLRAGRWDAAVIFTVHSQPALPAALLCHLAAIPRRLAHSADKPYGLLTEWVADPERDAPVRHEARRQLELLAAVGLSILDEHLSVRVPADASRRIRRRLSGLGIDVRQPWLLVHPGASASSRRYPGERWAAAAASLAAETGWPIVWSGGPNERSFVAELAGAAAVGPSVAGELPLPDLVALIALAPMLLTNNTGPAHLAAAVGTPVVDVYAQTNSQHAPWRVPNRVVFADVPCRGCERSVCPMGHHRCLLDVPASAVVSAALDLAVEIGLLARNAHVGLATGSGG